MKILVLSNVSDSLYLLRYELLSCLIAGGDSIFVSAPNSSVTAFLQSLGCTCIHTPFNRRGMNPFEDLKLLGAYLKLIRNIQPDVVFTYTIKPNVYGGMACRFQRTPCFASVTGLGTSIHNSGLLQKISLTLYRIGLKKAACVFYENADDLTYMAQHHILGKKARLMPGAGVNLEVNSFVEYPEEGGVIRFLYVGRIMRDKGINELITCARAIRQKYPNVHFDLAGSYDDSAYEETITQLQQEGIVHFYGRRSDIHDLMAQHHCIIHPSYHEGLSNVLLEAAACGRPVITTHVPGCRETFDEGETGFGVPAKDADALIDAVERFIRLPYAQKASMGQMARKKVEREFDRKIVVNAFLDELQNLEKTKPTR